MILDDKASDEDDGGGADDIPAETSPSVTYSKPSKVTPIVFFRRMWVDCPGGVQCVVFAGRDGEPNDHTWTPDGVEYGSYAARKTAGRSPAYFSLAAFQRELVSRYSGRKKANALMLRSFWFDIEGSAEKYSKPKGEAGGYPDGKAVIQAIAAFIKAVPGLVPNFLVLTGSGGAHIYFALDAPITVAEWFPRATKLVALAALHGFKVDAQCTTDAARIMRAPGSKHQKTGKEVEAWSWRESDYTLAELDAVLGYVPDASPAAGDVALRPGSGYDPSINADMYRPYSCKQVEKSCEALRRATENNGRDTPHNLWLLSLGTAKSSIEGLDYAHEISRGHADYDYAKTEQKLDSLTGGPPNQAAWAAAYGRGGPCDSCEAKTHCKNPAVQSGTVVDTTPPGAVALAEPDALLEWVAQLNTRFAVLRYGSKLVVVDFQTASMSGHGVVRGVGYLDIAAFRQMFAGCLAPLEKPGDKARSLADAWLCHPCRRVYSGMVFAPGEILPPDILNMWAGFAVEAIAGDVAPWLEVLAALVPGDADRHYVLHWLAWKIQHPGGVPDTVLVFKGAKGTGKNSLFEPIVSLFGRHAMVADDPELIVGRFTGHLMSLAFAVLDEAVFVNDPRQMDRVKARITAKVMHFEAKGLEAISGVNRCAYVMLTNHAHVWQATTDERRAVVVEAGESLRGNLAFWQRYHVWCAGAGPSALLHYLQAVDLAGFNPRQIPKGEALRNQIELTALRNPAVSWWHQCLTERSIRWGSGVHVVHLNDDAETEIDRASLRQSYEQSLAGRARLHGDWSSVARKLNEWAGPTGVQKLRTRIGGAREWRDVLPSLPVLRAAFTAATGVGVTE